MKNWQDRQDIDPNDLLGNKQRLKDLLDHRNGLRVHSIQFVEGTVLDQSTEKQLASIGLGHLTPIYFTIQGEAYSQGGMLHSASDNVRGCTISSIIDGQLEQIVLICKDLLDEPSLSDNDKEEFAVMSQLIALAHELGHVEDARSREDSSFIYGDSPTINLVRAEAYAHSYCLNYLNRIGATTARNTMANALYRMNKSRHKFEKALYTSVCNTVGKGRIKKWSNA